MTHENLKEFTCHHSFLLINGAVSVHYRLQAKEMVRSHPSVLSASPHGLLPSIPSISKPLLFVPGSKLLIAKQCQTQPGTGRKRHRHNQEGFFKVTSLTDPRGQPRLHMRRTRLVTANVLPPSQRYLEASTGQAS